MKLKSNYILKISVLFSCFLLVISCENSSNESKDFTTLFEISKGTETPEYKDVISYYNKLSLIFFAVVKISMTPFLPNF